MPGTVIVVPSARSMIALVSPVNWIGWSWLLGVQPASRAMSVTGSRPPLIGSTFTSTLEHGNGVAVGTGVGVGVAVADGVRVRVGLLEGVGLPADAGAFAAGAGAGGFALASASPARIGEKAAVSDHLPRGKWGQRHRRPAGAPPARSSGPTQAATQAT